MMDEKKTVLIVLFLIFLVAVPSIVFLFSDNALTGNYFEGPLYTWEYGGNHVMVYPDRILAYRINGQTGFYYDSPVFQARLNNRAGCPLDCWSVGYDKVRDFQRLGLSVDFYGSGSYACFCPEQLKRFS
ncbi:hypothetical protein DRJ25_02425 [Candidatus Woesearchaeota archaeon]|nr:MAG: hypothetical protein DRJ25_02425 [Candidatus Woesearchaeota archaeon]